MNYLANLTQDSFIGLKDKFFPTFMSTPYERPPRPSGSKRSYIKTPAEEQKSFPSTPSCLRKLRVKRQKSFRSFLISRSSPVPNRSPEKPSAVFSTPLPSNERRKSRFDVSNNNDLFGYFTPQKWSEIRERRTAGNKSIFEKKDDSNMNTTVDIEDDSNESTSSSSKKRKASDDEAGWEASFSNAKKMRRTESDPNQSLPVCSTPVLKKTQIEKRRLISDVHERARFLDAMTKMCAQGHDVFLRQPRSKVELPTCSAIKMHRSSSIHFGTQTSTKESVLSDAGNCLQPTENVLKRSNSDQLPAKINFEVPRKKPVFVHWRI